MRYNFKISHKILLGTFALGTLFIGCQNNDNDIFEADPIVRLDNIAKAELKAKLVDSENGWIVNWSPDGNSLLGEFNMWMEFNADGSLLLKTDQDLTDLGTEISEYNFVKLNTLALSFPLGNKIHDFTAMSPYDLRTDIEFLLSKYNDDGSIEFTGHMTKQKIVFRKATAEDKNFAFTPKWMVYDKINAITKCTVNVNNIGTSYAWNNLADFRSSQIGNAKTGFLNDSEFGVVTFKASEDGSKVYVLPEITLKDGSTITELTLSGNSFIGISETNSTVVFSN